jgi:hypothetical protein
MNLEQCIFSRDTEEGCLPTSFSATDQLSLLSGMDTPAKSSESELPMDGSPACECMKGMSACSTHPSTPEAWIASMRDSLARTLASLESRQVYLREPDQVFTEKSCASLAWFDQSSSSWKTYQQSLVTGWEQYSETWPRWGMTAGGSAYAHPMSERRITETDGSHWLPTPTATANQMAPSMQKHRGCRNLILPTPTTIDAGTGRFNTSIGGTPRPTLALMARKNLWPTPTAHNAKETGAPSQMERKTVQLGDLVGGSLNPQFVEWLMGFPIGFTDSKGWVMPKSRSKPQQPTACSEGVE